MPNDYVLLTPQEHEIEDVQEIKSTKTAGIPSSVFNTLGCIIGGGVLALPYTFSLTGIVLGIALVLFVALLSAFAVYLLIKTSLIQFGRPASYRTLAGENFGRFGVWFVEITQIVDLVGACAGYLVIVGEIATSFAQQPWAFGPDSWASDKRFVTAVVLVLVPLPLSFLKKISALSYTSTLSFVCIWFVTGAIIFRSVQYLSEESDSGHTSAGDLTEIRLAKWGSGVFRAIPIVSFAFNFHLQVYAIWDEMKDQRKVAHVFGSSIGVSIFLYILVGIFGYLSFFRGTSESILQNYGDDVLFQVAAGLLGFMICFSYPLLSFPLLESVDNLLFPGAPVTFKRRIPEAVLLAIVAWGLAVASPNIAVVFGYAGATLGNLLVFIIPASFYIRAARSSGRRWYRHPALVASWLLVLTGLFLVVASLWAITADLLSGSDSASLASYL